MTASGAYLLRTVDPAEQVLAATRGGYVVSSLVHAKSALELGQTGGLGS